MRTPLVRYKQMDKDTTKKLHSNINSSDKYKWKTPHQNISKLILTMYRTSLVLQWIGIHLLCMAPRFDPWSNSTYLIATTPAHPNYWCLHALGYTSHNYWAWVLRVLKPEHLESAFCKKRGHVMKSPRTTTKSSSRGSWVKFLLQNQELDKNAHSPYFYLT